MTSFQKRVVKEDKSSFSPFFADRVYGVVKRISKGEVLSYRQVAILSHSPKAFRAVGNILNKNKNPKVPCHRVIRSDGTIGGYKYGARKKINLLKNEGVVIVKEKISLPSHHNKHKQKLSRS